jgi:DNA-directed RNA polymerase specialized sigma24 family protein
MYPSLTPSPPKRGRRPARRRPAAPARRTDNAPVEGAVARDDAVLFAPFTRAVIRRKCRQLIGRGGLTAGDRKDLEQELLLHLIRGLPGLDRGVAHRNVFVTVVIDRSAAQILRRRRARKRDGGPVLSLDELAAAGGDAPGEPTEESRPCARGGRRTEQERIDLASDLKGILVALPAALRALTERLKTQSLSEAARALGLPRSTPQCRVRRIRRRFEDAGLRAYL